MVRGVRRYSSVRVCGGGRWFWWRWRWQHRHCGMDVVQSMFAVECTEKIVDGLGESNFIMMIFGIN